jgi:hypothetical protein
LITYIFMAYATPPVEFKLKLSSNSSVGIATGYRLESRGGARDFSLFQSVQTSSGAYSTFYSSGYGGALPLGW